MRRGRSHETAAAAVFHFVGRRGGDQITQELRVNDKIRAKEVRVVAPDGSQIGVRKIEEARWLASQLGLDLVEVAPDAKPPVCRMMDYGKYKYEQSVRQREARKKQTRTVVKEVKFRPKIDTHDYEVKKRRVIEFLDEGDKVKITMMFRGREVTHPELGERILKRLAADVVGIGGVETGPKLEGRNMTMQLTPEKRRREADEGSAADETTTGDLAAGTNDDDAATAAEE
ncbi:MAG: translation initiation factor IF-3 [Acidimicrobiia bacterium]